MFYCETWENINYEFQKMLRKIFGRNKNELCGLTAVERMSLNNIRMSVKKKMENGRG
jgi:hypothetical protein